MLKHGHNLNRKQTPTYQSWRNMKRRCTVTYEKDYSNYGGRGIKYCARWENFTAFLQDMGEKPDGYTLERIDNNGNYEPNNCKWIPKAYQNYNKRVQKRNKIGHTGIRIKQLTGGSMKYIARISNNGFQKHIGSFDTLEKAIVARKQAEEKEWCKYNA